MQTFRRRIVKRESVWGTIGVPREVMSAWYDFGFTEVELQWNPAEPGILHVVGSTSAGDNQE